MNEPTVVPRAPKRKPAAERYLELWLFRSRWLMAPFYVGLVFALAALFFVFVQAAIKDLSHLGSMSPEEAILMALTLIDLSLAGNLLLIVIFSGYENFVSKIDTGDDEDRPGWMGTVDFSGLKLKLVASIMELAEGKDISDRHLAWLVGIHLVFVISGVLLALMDWLASKTDKH
jgi:uncharacterized protein (TIGR00645 family)